MCLLVYFAASDDTSINVDINIIMWLYGCVYWCNVPYIALQGNKAMNTQLAEFASNLCAIRILYTHALIIGLTSFIIN